MLRGFKGGLKMKILTEIITIFLVLGLLGVSGVSVTVFTQRTDFTVQIVLLRI